MCVCAGVTGSPIRGTDLPQKIGSSIFGVDLRLSLVLLSLYAAAYPCPGDCGDRINAFPFALVLTTEGHFSDRWKAIAHFHRTETKIRGLYELCPLMDLAWRKAAIRRHHRRRCVTNCERRVRSSLDVAFMTCRGGCRVFGNWLNNHVKIYWVAETNWF